MRALQGYGTAISYTQSYQNGIGKAGREGESPVWENKEGQAVSKYHETRETLWGSQGTTPKG